MKKEISKIHPQLLQIANRTPKFDFNKKNLWLMRLIMSIMPKAKTPQSVSIENIFIESGQAKIRLRVYKPKMATTPTPVLIWMHGGGYVVGKPEQDDGCCSQYVQELGITVVSVDYRYAPEHHFPIGLEDCYTALKWVVSQARDKALIKTELPLAGLVQVVDWLLRLCNLFMTDKNSKWHFSYWSTQCLMIEPYCILKLMTAIM
jgi:acetyl esterase/lipase